MPGIWIRDRFGMPPEEEGIPSGVPKPKKPENLETVNPYAHIKDLLIPCSAQDYPFLTTICTLGLSLLLLL